MKKIVQMSFLLVCPMMLLGASGEERRLFGSSGERAQIIRNTPYNKALDVAENAAGAGDLEKIKSLVDTKQLNVNDRNKEGETLLKFVVRRMPFNPSFGEVNPSLSEKKYAIAQWLLEHGANPNLRARGDNNAALHEAVENNDKRMVKLLVKHGADINLPDLYQQNTPLHMATNAYPKDREMISLLLSLGADRNKINKYGKKPFDE